MRPADLQAVADVELASYQFPWNIGIFRDCLLAGYQSLVLEIGG
ncbi:MAG: ribosomal-protein-alanine N-acetyltransferase, partial [Gammaproteobacteria bacterium]|nr:ribosomal-protein-alanine N-acetyltransferase [Gammaproteobacteria bacterium]